MSYLWCDAVTISFTLCWTLLEAPCYIESFLSLAVAVFRRTLLLPRRIIYSKWR